MALLLNGAKADGSNGQVNAPPSSSTATDRAWHGRSHRGGHGGGNGDGGSDGGVTVGSPSSPGSGSPPYPPGPSPYPGSSPTRPRAFQRANSAEWRPFQGLAGLVLLRSSGRLLPLCEGL
jgi:hypothetical protein